MKAYRFSLDAVLRVRTLQERIAREQLMVAQRKLRQAQGRCTALQASMDGLALPTEPTRMGTIHWIGEQAGRLSEEVVAIRELSAAAATALEDASRVWHDARKRMGTLERLDSEGMARWKDAAAREEVAELDDLASTRHGLRVVRA